MTYSQQRQDFLPPLMTSLLVSAGTTSIRLTSDVRNFGRLSELPKLERLWCFDVDEKRMETISRCQSLQRLYIDGGRIANIDALLGLGELRFLSLDSMRMFTSLDKLARFVGLSGLSIENAAKVKSLEPLQSLTKLGALSLSGGMYSTMKVESLGPLQSLKSLHFLSLLNVKARDASLSPLRGLDQLRILELPNFYPVKEFARLAACLKNTSCQWFSPWIDCSGSVFRCAKCGGNSGNVMLTGGGARILCRDCDAERVKKHEACFHHNATAA